MPMKLVKVALSGFGPANESGNYPDGKQFGTLEIDEQTSRAELQFDPTAAVECIVEHPVIGSVPHYQACLYDMCISAYEGLLSGIKKNT